MKWIRLHILLYIGICAGLLVSPSCWGRVEAKDFVLVIDAGHGGHDPGAIGRISKEKDINLRVALAVGRLIEQNCPDVKVLYTRKRDVFVPLDRRSAIANEAKADLFISIHTNSLANNHTARGASTWTLGLAKSDANLKVAQRENAVILYEDDYQTRYAGFNPNSAFGGILHYFRIHAGQVYGAECPPGILDARPVPPHVPTDRPGGASGRIPGAEGQCHAQRPDRVGLYLHSGGGALSEYGGGSQQPLQRYLPCFPEL